MARTKADREIFEDAVTEEERKRSGYASDEPMPDHLTRELAEIKPAGLDHREVVSATLQALVKANAPERAFVQGGVLSRLLVDEKGMAKLELMDDAALGVKVMQAVSFRAKNGSPLAAIPKYVLPSVRKLGDYPGIPAIEAIVEVPVLRPDGSVLDRSGYDRDSGLYYHPTRALAVPKIPTEPTREQAKEALEHVRFEVLGDFPFATPTDEANMLGLLLTPIIRHLVALAPIALITAPVRGSGKGLLVGACTQLATGRPAPTYGENESEAEFRKWIDSKMLAGATFVYVDEVKQLSSKSLQTAVTASHYDARRLGRSVTVTVPQWATWVVSGNNVVVGADLGRRSYPIRLDPKMERPWTRSGFRHPELEDWVAENRGELLAALLTAARAWWVAGRPPANVSTIGSFGAWTETVGGILSYAGVETFLGGLDDHWDVAEEGKSEWEEFLRAIKETMPADEWATRDLAEKVNATNRTTGLHRFLPSDLEDEIFSKSFMTKLGIQLGLRVDSRHGADELRITRVRTARNGQPRWRVDAG